MKFNVTVTYRAVGVFHGVEAKDADEARELVRQKCLMGVEPDAWVEYEAEDQDDEERFYPSVNLAKIPTKEPT